MKALYIIHPTPWLKMTIRLLPFVSPKFWNKMINIDDVFQLYKFIHKDQISLPDEVFTHNHVVAKARPVFGVPLSEVVLYSNSQSGLPIVVEKCIEYILQKGTLIEGIFRLSGSSVQIEELKTAFDRGEEVNLSVIDDPHAVAGLLKLYLRELPEPPFTYALYDSCISTHDALRRTVLFGSQQSGSYYFNSQQQTDSCCLIYLASWVALHQKQKPIK